ncbi:M23 family metallopeptidase [Paeniglutamicibacter gangotriensis]|uniref:M23 family metallopeptidase n=1 Tax=Paeniglutamicibacter gangotriensis TaxID=254787 RepID=UPI0037C6CAF2
MRAIILALYRLRVPLFAVSIIAIFAGTVLGRLLSDGQLAWAVGRLPPAGLAGMVAGYLLALFGARLLGPPPEPIIVVSPVAGRWLGMNSPVDKVPSHGVRVYGQAHAIDLVHEPIEIPRPAFGGGPAMRRCSDYPAFGQPLRSMVAGTVVKASDSQRDHRARSNKWALVYLMAEGALRELGGPRFVVGNHTIVRTEQGNYALLAHLKQGSALVRRGDTVEAGEVLAACGNTGNSSEPHVHAQLMDGPSLWTAQGIPMVFADISIGAEQTVRDGLPGNGEHFTAS